MGVPPAGATQAAEVVSCLGSFMAMLGLSLPAGHDHHTAAGGAAAAAAAAGVFVTAHDPATGRRLCCFRNLTDRLMCKNICPAGLMVCQLHFNLRRAAGVSAEREGLAGRGLARRADRGAGGRSGRIGRHTRTRLRRSRKSSVHTTLDDPMARDARVA